MAKKGGQSRRRGLLAREVFGLAAALLVAVGFVVADRSTDWPLYAKWVAACSGATFILFLWDKSKAITRGQRVPESVLLLLILAGGFLGGWAGMFLARHKIRDGTFWAALILASVVHVLAAVAWLL